MGLAKSKIVFEVLLMRDEPYFSRRTLWMWLRKCATELGYLFKGRLVALGTVQEMLTQQNQGNLEEVFLQITQEQMDAQQG